MWGQHRVCVWRAGRAAATLVVWRGENPSLKRTDLVYRGGGEGSLVCGWTWSVEGAWCMKGPGVWRGPGVYLIFAYLVTVSGGIRNLAVSPAPRYVSACTMPKYLSHLDLKVAITGADTTSS